MKTTAQWIEQAITQLDVTAYRLAKMMQADTSLVTAYRNGRQIISEGHAIKLGELMGIDPLPIVATAAYERSKTDQMRAFWARHAETVTTAVAVVLVGGTLLTAPASADAREMSALSSHNSTGYTLGKRYRRRKRAGADRWVREITGHLPGFFSSSRSASHSHD